MTQSRVPHGLRNRLHSTNIARWLGVLVIAATVLSLVLTGGGSAAAETPTPGAPGAPRVGGGYPIVRPDYSGPAAASAAAPDTAGSWSTGQLCVDGQQCLVGDFNGDGRDDVAVAIRDTQGDPYRGDVNVALSDSARFGTLSKWADSICVGAQFCKVGDVNADGADDIVAFDRVYGDVWVALSQKTSFAAPTLWQSSFCKNNQTCEVANVDGVPGDDIITFMKGPDGNGTNGDVLVALSNGINGFSPVGKWHDFFCIKDEECHVADVSGDGKADAILFVKTGDGKGRVSVARSTGYSFGTSEKWADYFCIDNEQCETGNFDGRQGQDLLTFLRAGSDSATYGDIYVAPSANSLTGNSAGLLDSTRWHDYFCFPGDDCAVGDFNGDGRTDVVRFAKASTGEAFVALSSGNPTGFVSSVPDGDKWQDAFCPDAGPGTVPGTTNCVTGDFNGDGLDDVMYFTRNASGQVFVELSNRASFGVQEQWSQDAICSYYADICRVGDVNGDGADDIVVFSRLQYGKVLVYLSQGKNGVHNFATRADWTPLKPGNAPPAIFCVGLETCDVGDYNGDGRADIALFTRSLYGGARDGDVEVALSYGYTFIHTGYLWHNFFCIQNEVCTSGDVNGDGRADLISFRKDTDARVFVAISNGYVFADPSETWDGWFCQANEICGVGDFNGDRRTDIVAFLRSDYANPPYSNPTTIGNVWVGLSQGSLAAGGFNPSHKWNQSFCTLQDTCATGDFNGDGLTDIVRFSRGTSAGVYVALATVGKPPYSFVDSTPPPVVQKMLLNLLIRRR